mgnify:CR=1 FL=1
MVGRVKGIGGSNGVGFCMIGILPAASLLASGEDPNADQDHRDAQLAVDGAQQLGQQLHAHRRGIDNQHLLELGGQSLKEPLFIKHGSAPRVESAVSVAPTG